VEIITSDQDEDEDGEGGAGVPAEDESDPTYELATARRSIAGTEPLSRFIENSRKMFMLQVNIIKSKSLKWKYVNAAGE
jgi:hypothetical protein